MEAVLKFNLPEDQYEFMIAQRASDMRRVIDEMKEYFRSQLKYNEESIEKLNGYEAIEKASQKFYDIMNSCDVNTDNWG